MWDWIWISPLLETLRSTNQLSYKTMRVNLVLDVVTVWLGEIFFDTGILFIYIYVCIYLYKYEFINFYIYQQKIKIHIFYKSKY